MALNYAVEYPKLQRRITELKTLNDNLERQFAEDTARIKALETELASYIESDGNLREKVKELQD